MHISNTGVLVNDNTEVITDQDQLKLNARLFFHTNPFNDHSILKEYLDMAEEMDKLDSAKVKKKIELVHNKFIKESPDFFVTEQLLDTTRLEAFKLIEEA